jgi:Uma2 family endonuclease
MSANLNPAPTVTLDEYLALDAASDVRFEYCDGFVFMMAPPSFRHTQITTNISNALNAKLTRENCVAYTSTIRILTEARGARYYPDVSVICGKPKIVKEEGDSVTNPLVIFEVMSPDSKRRDLGEKLKAYQAISSLAQYVVIAQDSAHVKSWTKRGSRWPDDEVAGLNKQLELPALKVVLSLTEIYRGVSFE